MENKPASAPQRWAIFVKTGYDVRGVILPNEIAKTILDKEDSDAIAFVSALEGAVKKQDKKPKQDWQAVWDKAYTAGMKAGKDIVPVPMGVVSGNQLVEVVNDGCCGFAWVVVKPGSHSFAKWAKANKDARAEYGGGMCVYWVGEFNQSMTRKEAFAHAFAQVLKEHNVPAYSRSRMD